MYGNMAQRQRRVKTYGEAFMQMTPERIRRWANWTFETMKDQHGKVHPMWIVPAAICVRDRWYQPEDVVPQLELIRQA